MDFSKKLLTQTIKLLTNIEGREGYKCWRCGAKLDYREKKFYCPKCKKVRKYMNKNPMETIKKIEE